MTDDLILQRLATTFGLTERSTWRRELVSVLGQVEERRCLDRAGLIRELQTDADLLREVAGHLTIDESHFLRHPRQYDLLLAHLARLLDETPPGARLYVWSAGCAKGEEPYSVALLACERFGEHRAARIEVLANDINREALERGRRAVFTPWSFRGVPDALVQRYFRMTDAGYLALAPTIAKRVEFEHVSIQERLARTPSSETDVILFRNVAIYLAPEATREIYAGLFAALRPGGLLFVAPADPLPPSELFARSAEDVAGAFVRRPVPKRAAAGAAFAQLRFQAASPTDPGDQGRAPKRAGLESGHTGSAAEPPRAQSAPQTQRRDAARASPLNASPATDHGVAADQQRIALELQLASRVIATSPTAPHGYLLRGRLLMAQQRPAEAVDDFRRALFVGVDNRVARFWYAAALQRAGNIDRARSQAARLAVQLAALPGDEVLEDGQTMAAGLLRAVELMKTSLQ